MNVTQALAALRALALLIPIIIELARALDSIDGEDAAKIHVVLEAVKAAFEKITDLGIDWESFRPLVEKIIDPILKLIRSKA